MVVSEPMASAAWSRLSGGEPPAHPGKSLGQFVLDSLRAQAASNTKPAQVEAVSGTSKSYPELYRETVQSAAGWRSLGISTSDVIVIFARNSHHKFTALIGALFEGITMATVPPNVNANELRLLLTRVNIRAVVCEPFNLQVALTVLPEETPILVAADTADPSWPPAARLVPDLLRLGAAVDVDAYDAADVGDLHKHVPFIPFSSGTTGLPKGVMCTNYGITMNAVMKHWSILPDDTVLVTSPVSWITGILYTIIPISLGATRVLWTYTNENEFLAFLTRHKITMTFIAPARYCLLAGLVTSLRQKGITVDLSHWRLGMAGGAAMSAHVQKTCVEVLGVPIIQGYGCTELLLISSDTLPLTYGSAGRVGSGARVKFVDVQTGREIREPGVEGELRLKSSSFMLGYVGDPETTAESIDEEGWYRSGDLGKFDRDGKIFITDRIKELIKFMNLEMAPAEIEGVLMSHRAVKAACVVGRFHEVVGDIPTAFVTLQQEMKVSEQELQELVKARLSQHKQLRGGVFIVDEIPASANGKFDRKTLRSRLSKLPPVSDEVLGISTS